MRKHLASLVFLGLLFAFPAAAQQPADDSTTTEKEKKTDDQSGIGLPNTEKFRLHIRFMAGYTFDAGQSSLGFEKQGRIGYATIGISGKLNEHFRYVLEVNPVNETQPGVSCGEDNYYYPNAAQNIGPKVACDNNGRQRVDDYRFVALDSLMQQGPIRQAYGVFTAGPMALQFGRFILPIGFGVEEAGSFSAKDATHIQRINTEASFGFMTTLTKARHGRKFATVSLAGIIGDGNKYRDYDYFYGIDGSMDSNSWPTMLLSGTVEPVAGLQLRAAWKQGDTGSKVERLPNFFASKRNDNAVVLSARYQPVTHLTVFGESARYTWGLKDTSAKMLDLDPHPVLKRGYYIGGDFNYPLTKSIRLGTTITREELSRDDALVKLFAGLGQYRVQVGKQERSTVWRVYADVANAVRVGVFHNSLSNPYPWLSGIIPVSGPGAFSPGRGSDKWGVIVNFKLQ